MPNPATLPPGIDHDRASRMRRALMALQAQYRAEGRPAMAQGLEDALALSSRSLDTLARIIQEEG